MDKTVLITGGAGYVGSALVPSLLKDGYKVIVYDLYLFGDVFKEIKNKNLIEIKGDIRDKEKLVNAGKDADYFIHLACISNDPSFDLDPRLGKSVNYDAFQNVIDACTFNGIKRLIVASSTSQYGIKPIGVEVTEETEAEPITDYAKYKLKCEKELLAKDPPGLEYVFVRPATLCGYAPRLRLDLSVNILTAHALTNRKIKVFGGSQMRPALNIEDIVRFYKLMLEAPTEKIHKQAFNVSYKNYTMMEIANEIKKAIGDNLIDIEVMPTDDLRSYHINTDKMKKVLGFECKYSIADAVNSLVVAYNKGLIKDALNNPIYHNIKLMQSVNLK